MVKCNEIEALTKAFSGFGVDEQSLITILGKLQPGEVDTFRKGTHFFVEDEKSQLFHKFSDHILDKLRQEFLRFKTAMVLWIMHPWERDARLMKDALMDGPKSYNVVIELACTRSSEELLGARRAYHSLFDRSIEEDVGDIVSTGERKLLVALVSAYRYEGPKVHKEIAKSEAKILISTIKNEDDKDPIENEEAVRILATRSKLHLDQVFKHYNEIAGTSLDEDLVDNTSLKYTVQCLSNPQAYFIKVLDEAMDPSTDENTKEGLIRVVVTRANADLQVINEGYRKKYGVSLVEKIKETTNGNFKDFLLTLLARSG